MADSLLTSDQLGKIGKAGRIAEEYWREYLPKMYAEMAESGELYPTLLSKGRRLDKMAIEMITQDGLQEYQALEFVNEEIFSLPPEETEEDE